MTDLHLFVESNQQLLKQLSHQLKSISSVRADVYRTINDKISTASIGQHVRHIIDFYDCFTQGLIANFIDYDLRSRLSILEVDVNAAIDKLNDIHTSLQHLKQYSDHDLSIRNAISTVHTTLEANSSTSRELLFLHGHATHHLAIIAILFRTNKIDVDENFGKAPSTIAYESQRK